MYSVISAAGEQFRRVPGDHGTAVSGPTPRPHRKSAAGLDLDLVGGRAFFRFVRRRHAWRWHRHGKSLMGVGRLFRWDKLISEPSAVSTGRA
jgi:hypothetical protein